MNLEKLKNLQFISKRLTIKINHLNKDDTKHVLNVLNNKIGSLSFVVAIIMAFISIAVFFYLQLSSGFKQVETYGVGSIIADIGCFSMCLITIILKIISSTIRSEKSISILNRFSIICLYIAIAILMFGSFYADAEKGFLSETPTMSVSIIVLAFLLIVQPVFALDATILNTGIIATMTALAIYTKIKFDIQSIVYYILIVLVFILLSRLLISIIFYAEVQKYMQESLNNSLLDTAMYDELTHCKNRFALKKYLEEKVPEWKSKKTDLLVVMFDIDNFKEYNDYFSHPVGDKCLVNIANAIKQSFHTPSLEFYRYGGEEFLLFFELEKDEQAEGILEQIRLSAAELMIKAPSTSKTDYLTISVGGCRLHTNSEFDFSKALSSADSNLYKAKANGKNVCYLNGNKVKRMN